MPKNDSRELLLSILECGFIINNLYKFVIIFWVSFFGCIRIDLGWINLLIVGKSNMSLWRFDLRFLARLVFWINLHTWGWVYQFLLFFKIFNLGLFIKPSWINWICIYFDSFHFGRIFFNFENFFNFWFLKDCKETYKYCLYI